MCGVLRGERIHWKKQAESPTSGFEIRILLMSRVEWKIFLSPRIPWEPHLALRPAKILRGVRGLLCFLFEKKLFNLLAKALLLKWA